MVPFHEKIISEKFKPFKMKVRGGAKPFKFEWVFPISMQEYHHYEQKSLCFDCDLNTHNNSVY